MSWLEHQENAPAGFPCMSFVLFSLSHTHTHTHLWAHTHTDLHLWRLGWWGLGEKRQSSVPWRRSSGSGQDSARCNPSQVMLFTFSHFQLICLNAPSSIPKKPPPFLNQHNLRGRREGGRAAAPTPRCRIKDHFSAFSIQHSASIWPLYNTKTPSVLQN